MRKKLNTLLNENISRLIIIEKEFIKFILKKGCNQLIDHLDITKQNKNSIFSHYPGFMIMKNRKNFKFIKSIYYFKKNLLHRY